MVSIDAFFCHCCNKAEITKSNVCQVQKFNKDQQTYIEITDEE